jgi:hypothetical protein
MQAAYTVKWWMLIKQRTCHSLLHSLLDWTCRMYNLVHGRATCTGCTSELLQLALVGNDSFRPPVAL